MSTIVKLQKNQYGFVEYAEIKEDDHVHHFEYINGCAAMVCYDCQQHAKVSSTGSVSYPFSHCWCGWKCGPAEQAEFASEFEDY